MLWLPLSVALAQVPHTVRPAVAPADAAVHYAQLREARGLPAASLACEPLWNEALLCFRVWEGTRRRWVVHADLETWGVTASDLRSVISERALEKLGGLESRSIDGMNHRYLQLVDGDGWSAGIVLHPERVARELGASTLMVAVPTDQISLAWSPGDPDADKILAVAVRELFDGEQGLSVTPMIYAWSHTGWRSFGEARPEGAPVE